MVRIAGSEASARALKSSFVRLLLKLGLGALALLIVFKTFTAHVDPDEYGVEQVRFGLGKTGIREHPYGPGLYFVPPGTTMHTFPREIHVLEATDERRQRARATTAEMQRRLEEFFSERERTLGEVHRVIDALNVQTSDGYAVTADVTLLYSIADPVRVAKDFGWGSLYVDSFIMNTFRNGVLTTLGKMNAESFYNGPLRVEAVREAEGLLRARLAERGFQIDALLLRDYRYADNYEKSLHDKKVAVQLTEKNRKEQVVNEGRAKLQQIESKGNATITIAESEVAAQIARVRAEAELYASQTRAKADQEVNVAQAEAKRLKAEALTQSGGRYVVALETAKMFDNIDGAVMTPEQYIAFVRNVWSLIGVSPGGAAPPAAPAAAGVRP